MRMGEIPSVRVAGQTGDRLCNDHFDMLTALLPESLLLVTALAVLGLGVSAPGARASAAVLALLGGFLAAAALVFLPVDGEFLGGMIVLDPLARLFKLVILGLGLVAVVFACESFPAAHFAESLGLVLFSVIGMMLLAGTGDLLMIFLALELTSIPLYVLAAFDRGRTGAAAARR
jgi:NADH-quinone oxidoreductase subunit N